MVQKVQEFSVQYIIGNRNHSSDSWNVYVHRNASVRNRFLGIFCMSLVFMYKIITILEMSYD